MPDNPVTYAVLQEERDRVDNYPRSLKFVLDGVLETFIVDFQEEYVTIKQVSGVEVKWMRLSHDLFRMLRDVADAWDEKHAEWSLAQEKEHAAWQRSQQAAEAMTAEPSIPCAEPGCEFLVLPGAVYCPVHRLTAEQLPDLEQDYENGLLSKQEYEQATREAAPDLPDVTRVLAYGKDEAWEQRQREADEVPADWNCLLCNSPHWGFTTNGSQGVCEDCERKRREAAENGEQLPDLEPRCVAVGCTAPALRRIGEFWYCDFHAQEPIPF